MVFWNLLDSLKGSPLGDLSFTTYIQLDCSIFRIKRLNTKSYINSMGEGENSGEWTPEDEWEYPKPNSSGETLYNKVCEEHQ